MDIKEMVFQQMIQRYQQMYAFQKEGITKAAKLMKECMEQHGVIQVCGIHHGEEFVNELNYRAGGLVPVHGMGVQDIYVRGYINDEEKDTFFDNAENWSYFKKLYELHPNDMYILVSLTGKEPLLQTIVEEAKRRNQKVIIVCQKQEVSVENQTMLQQADLVLDVSTGANDYLCNIQGKDIGQTWTTVGNVMAQMLCSEVYRLYEEEGKECPILLSANLHGADLHNNALTDLYGKRVRG